MTDFLHVFTDPEDCLFEIVSVLHLDWRQNILHPPDLLSSFLLCYSCLDPISDSLSDASMYSPSNDNQDDLTEMFNISDECLPSPITWLPSDPGLHVEAM